MCPIGRFVAAPLLLLACGSPARAPVSAEPIPTPRAESSCRHKAVVSEAGSIQIPDADARVTLPLHVFARVPGFDSAVAVVCWADGTELRQELSGHDGVVIDNLNWPYQSTPGAPPTQPATLEIQSQSGQLLARRQVTILSDRDPNTREVQVFWVVDEKVQPLPRRIPRTQRVGAAALEELLWGPDRAMSSQYTTALPTPEQVRTFPGRRPDWGPRVRLLELTIDDGVARANFSREMQAYGGGSTRVLLIEEQISRTLTQFPSVQKVTIEIDGQEGRLAP